jgi:hypothetical protein
MTSQIVFLVIDDEHNYDRIGSLLSRNPEKILLGRRRASGLEYDPARQLQSVLETRAKMTETSLVVG